MAQNTNTLDRDDLATGGKKFREDLANVVYNISPTEVPFQSNAGRGTSSEVYKEWLIDALAAAAENAHIDGDNFSGNAVTTGNRLGNYNQISRKDIVVSRRANKVKKAGRRSEMAYQIAKGAKELRRDMELDSTKRHEAITSTASRASQAAGVSAWIRTNLSRGTSGTAPTLSAGSGTTANGYPDAIGTNGTDAALSQANLLAQCENAYDEGGNPNMVQVAPAVKGLMSNFFFTSDSARLATPYQDHGANPRGGISVVGAVDVYVTDFQVLDIVPNRFSPGHGSSEHEAQILDTNYWEVSMFDGYHVETISKVGDATRSMLVADWTVCSKNEAASAIVADIDATAAMVA